MKRKTKILSAVLASVACAAIFFAAQPRGRRNDAPPGFVSTDGVRFVVDGRPFRFVGANVAVMYGDEERQRMPETLKAAAQDGIKVIRVWAHGETSGAETQQQQQQPRQSQQQPSQQQTGGVPTPAWLHANPFRRGVDGWNEAAFVHLDRVLAEAARLDLRVQICLTNWWPDTGGVTQYLTWAGINDAYDTRQPYNVNAERAMLFYTNEDTRRFYRQHVERIVARRNTVTGRLYRDDPTILGYELMNEAQAATGRGAERRKWVAEMSAYIKSLDPSHLVTPGTWGYRFSWERREWLEEHALAYIDYCDVHHYPRDDADSHVTTPDALREFIDNRVAAAFSIEKPLVFGEFGIPTQGYNNWSREQWYEAYFAHAARAPTGGAMFWIWTLDATREYGVTPTDERDRELRVEFLRASRLFDSHSDADPPRHISDATQHLIPHQFAFARNADEMTAALPVVKKSDDETLLYRFTPEQAARGRFEKLGGGAGYVWGAGVGFFEYVVPARDHRRKVGEIVVRAHLQPTLPHDANGRIDSTRVTLFINGTDCESRLVRAEPPRQAFIQEWRIRALAPRARAALGQPLSIRFAVAPDADQPYGLNISNFPEGYDSRGAFPIEVEIK
ncbi:MAG TPA: cellulase family glycosylhydrolase [Pyrinomonadaceae bacterium]